MYTIMNKFQGKIFRRFIQHSFVFQVLLTLKNIQQIEKEEYSSEQ